MTLGDGAARRLANVLFTCMAIAMPLLSGGVVWALAVNKDQSDQLKSQLSQIQQQRADNTRDACDRQNVANARINTALLRLVPSPSRGQRDQIQLFANAIAPVQNCVVVVRQRVGKP